MGLEVVFLGVFFSKIFLNRIKAVMKIVVNTWPVIASNGASLNICMA